MALVDVLIPTCGRKSDLAIVLASLLGQTFADFDVTVSDQSPDDATGLDDPEIRTLVAALRFRGHQVALHRHLPRRGLTEQRQFLLIHCFGGCNILPCGTYHLGLPTTVPDRGCNATDLFADLLREQGEVWDEPAGVEARGG